MEAQVWQRVRAGKQEVVIHKNTTEPWKVTIIDTGLDTMTGGRVKRVAPYVGDKTFLLTYGDGVANVDIAAEVAFHRAHGKMLTITTVNPGQRFGTLDITPEGKITSFREKAESEGTLVNGGYMACEPSLFDFIADDATILEREPFERAAAAGELMGYRHHGFWQCMDNVREKQYLEKLWAEGNAPWKIW
jgi:glucose-1-phosphate cytidylyltransferase